MLVAGSYRHSLHPIEKETLALMDKDVEDEEFSDAESLEEITADDFNSRSRVLFPDQMIHPLTGDFFARDGFELPPAAPKTIKEVPLVVVIEDSSEDSGGESEEEEDEIELGLESGSVVKEEPGEVGSEEKQSEEMWDLDKSVNRIVETLAAITTQEVETSFDRVCSLLRKSSEILKQNFPETSGPLIGSLVQHTFMMIQTVHSVATSGVIEMEQNEEFVLRLLVQIKSRYSSGLTPDELKQLDVQIQYWTSVSSEKELHSGSEGSTSGTSHCSISSEKPCLEEPQEANSGFSNAEKVGLPKLAAPLDFGTKVGTFSLYDTHALQTVSSYQQKHSPTSFVVLTNNRLPSPTPSEECEDKDCADGEVSSPSVVDSVSLMLPHGPSGSVACMTSNHGVATDSSKKTLANSRDPRLRIINSEMDLGGIPVLNRRAGGLMDPRKHKAADDILDTRPSKRQMNGFSSSSDVATDAGGLMDPRKHKAADAILDTRPSKRQMNGFSSSGDVATDDSACHTTLFSNENGAVSSNVASMTLSEPDRNPAGKSRLTSPSASMNPTNDDGRTHSRHRDPRDILRNCRIPKSGSSKSEPANTSGNLLSDTQSHKDHFIVREQGEQAQAPSLPSHPMPLPGVAQPFLKNLKSIARVISSSSRSTNTKVNEKPPAPDSNDRKNASVSLLDGTKDTSEKRDTHEHVNQLLDGYNDEEKAAILKERGRRIEEQKKMFEARKLCLVLDLDHTLLNSVMFESIDPVDDEKLRKKEEEDRTRRRRHLFRLQHLGMWTKLRPGIWNFLKRASKLYELHLCTMGNKMYAAEMAKLLDPTGTLFAGRVISRGDSIDSLDGGDEMVPRVKDLEGVLGMESAVVIIDDSAKVWPHNQHNLIVVERYTYFPFSRRQFELPGPSLLEIGFDERSEDGTLASSLAVIERIHRNFFSNWSLSNIDVREILAAEQQKILSGCRIVFSRIFPTGEAKPHRHPLWITARRFGAECTDKIDDRVTHVVANSPGTDKVKWAMSNGRFVVKRGWVEASAFLYRRASEQAYAVKL